MIYELKIYKDPVYAEVVGHGKATVEDFKQITQELISHAQFVGGINFLHDYRDIYSGHLTIEEVMIIASMVASHREVLGNGRWALLVNDDLNFGMGRMWEALVSEDLDIDISVYRDESEALAWIKGS
jgi:hypothetical protein